MIIGKKILEFRQKEKMTQKEMAMKLNVSDKVISRWETGKSIPDVEMMLKISKLFGVSISQLYDYVGDVDINDEEKLSDEKIWSYIKYNIIACAFLFLVPLLILFSFAYSSNKPKDSILFWICLVVFFVSVVLFILAIVFEIVQFVKLKLFSDYKFFNKQYKNILFKYSIIYICFFTISVLACVIIFLSFVL